MAILVTLIDTKLVVQFSVRDDTVLILVVTNLSDSESVGSTPRGMWLGDASVTRGTIDTPGERQIFGDGVEYLRQQANSWSEERPEFEGDFLVLRKIAQTCH